MEIIYMRMPGRACELILGREKYEAGGTIG
jgi:hypothetical protein